MRVCPETCTVISVLDTDFSVFPVEFCLGGVPFGSSRVFLFVQLIFKTLNKLCCDVFSIITTQQLFIKHLL